MLKNVLEWIEKTCAQFGDKVAYKDLNKSLTFNELRATAMSIGTGLKCVKGNAPIAIISGRSVDTISAYMGIVYSGHAYAPIDATLPMNRIATIVDILKPAAIVVMDDYLEIAKQLSRGQIDVYAFSELRDRECDKDYLNAIRYDMVKTDPLYVIFTSGSTGKPKGVITSHESLMCYIESYIEVMGINCCDVLGNQSPLDYIAAIRDIYIPMRVGCSTVIIPQEYFMQPGRLFDCLNANQVSAVGWSVSAFTVMTSMKAFEYSKLQHLCKICFSGSVMPTTCLREWQQALPEALFVNQYGPTEATASCTYYIVSDLVDCNEMLPIGKPYNNYRVFLLNEDMTPTEDGEIGEICVSGPILALGYYNDIARTQQSFITVYTNGYPERIYKTGDYGRKREDGNREFHGRKDRQVKHMGHRVELDEIEFAAVKVHGIDECAVMYKSEDEVLHLFYSGNAEKQIVARELRKNIPSFMVPRRFHQMDKLPKLANGKINMIELRKEI